MMTTAPCSASPEVHKKGVSYHKQRKHQGLGNRIPWGVLKWGRATARSIAKNGLAACCGTTLLPYGNLAMTDSAFVST
jgi:hypothetical protein